MAEAAVAGKSQLRRYALYGSAALVAGALAYGAYRSDAVAQTRQSLARLRGALQKYAEALSSGADLCCTLVRDLQAFLQSDSAEMPGSLRQLATLLQSREVAQTTASTVSAVYRGLAGEPQAHTGGGSPAAGDGALDKVLAALLSDRGQSLVSVAVSMGARNMVGALVESTQQQGQQAPPLADKLLDFMGTERGQRLAVAAITAFVTNGVRAYVDATLDINFYEDIFASMSRPAHLEAVKECIGMFAREAVGTAISGGGGTPQPSPQRSSRPTLIQELSPPLSPHSLTGTVHSRREQQQQQQQECPEFRGSPLDSAFRSSSPGSLPFSPPVRRRLNGQDDGSLGQLDEEEEEATSSELPQEQQQQTAGGIRRAAAAELGTAAADDLDSDSLLHAHRQLGALGKGQPLEQREAPNPSMPWLPLVTKELLTVVGDPNARSLMVGAAGAAAGATARELGAAAVAGLGQLEVTRRWGTRGLVALVLLTFLAVCLAQELLRLAVLGFLR